MNRRHKQHKSLPPAEPVAQVADPAEPCDPPEPIQAPLPDPVQAAVADPQQAPPLPPPSVVVDDEEEEKDDDVDEEIEDDEVVEDVEDDEVDDDDVVDQVEVEEDDTDEVDPYVLRLEEEVTALRSIVRKHRGALKRVYRHVKALEARVKQPPVDERLAARVTAVEGDLRQWVARDRREDAAAYGRDVIAALVDAKLHERLSVVEEVIQTRGRIDPLNPFVRAVLEDRATSKRSS